MLLPLKIIALGFLLAWSVGQVKSGDKPRVVFELRCAEREPAEGLIAAEFDAGRDKVYLHKEAALTNKDILEAHAIESERADIFSIDVLLTAKGTEKIAKLTEQRVGKLIAVMLNGKVMSAPMVTGRISSDRIVIAGNFTKAAAEKLANGINSH